MTNPAEQAAQTAEYTAAHAEIDANEKQGQGYAILSAIGVKLIQEFAQAENDRRETELRWLEDLRQYKGQYSPEVLSLIGSKRSKAFVRKTRVKVKTVDSRCMDLLFPANGNRNWDIAPTPNPSITPEQKKQIVQDLTIAMNPPPQPGQPPQPQRKPSRDDIDKAVRQMCEASSKAMIDTLNDQLSETKYRECARKVIHSGDLYGTGVLKAPLVERKIRQRFLRNGRKWELKTEAYITPFVDYVPLWRFFPDMQATEIDDCRYVYERHLMTKTGMLRLADRKTFDKVKIIDYVMSNPDGQSNPKFYDTELKTMGEREATQLQNNGIYEVLERWGWLDSDSLRQAGVTVPQERMHETFFSNVWLLPSGQVIKAVLQPINGVTWPYHLFYFDKDETSIFGEGVATVMRDDQTMLNAGVRMILDNAAITAGPQLEVNMRLLVKNEKAEEMYPFKIWPRTGEDPGAPALRTIELASHIPELAQIVQMFEANADETTAIPRYMTGENPTNGAAETASGLSMLMGAASIVLKDIISAFDEGITKPFITALYRWNMQFNKDDRIKGDYDVVATGTSSLVAKEVRAQQLDNFAASTSNQLDSPYIKREVLLRQRSEAHDLKDVVKTEDEVRQDQDNPTNQAAAQLQQMTQELQITMLKLNAALLEKKIDSMTADAERTRADALQKRLAAAYEAMQAAGIAIGNPGAAAAGDALLRDAGWEDRTPGDGQGLPVVQGTQQQPTGTGSVPQPDISVPQPTPPIPQRAGPEVGMRQGIETARMTDG